MPRTYPGIVSELTTNKAGLESGKILRYAVMALLCLGFANMLYCSMSYEFGWGAKPLLTGPGPQDRFADLLKVSLSYRSVTHGADRTKDFSHWYPIYQRYYEHPVYGGIKAVENGTITNLHHPPLSSLIFLVCGYLTVHTGSPTLILYLFFLLYLCEISCVVWIGIPRGYRTLSVMGATYFFCLLSAPALTIFSRGAYVDAGLTSIGVLYFLVVLYLRKRADFASLFALAIAVNVHPNAIIFMMALPFALGIRRSLKPLLIFFAVCGTIFGLSYLATHALYPAYTLANFRRGLADYAHNYVAGAAGLGGATPYTFVRIFFHNVSVPRKLEIFYTAGISLGLFTAFAYGRAIIRSLKTHPHRGTQTADLWPSPLVPFLLAAFFCILSPVFADYHLLVFVAPLLLACLQKETIVEHPQQWIIVVACSLWLLAPSNYRIFRIPLNQLLDPFFLCFTVLFLAVSMANRNAENHVPAITT